MQSRTKVKSYLNIHSGYMSWMMGYAKPYLPQIIMLMLFDLISTVITVGLAVISKKIIDTATSGEMDVTAILFYVGVVLGSILLTAISSILNLIISERFSFRIRKQVYEKIIHSYWIDVEKYHTGDLMTRLTSDVGSVADGVIYIFPGIIRLFLELIITFGTLYYYEPLLAILAAVIAPVAGLGAFFIGKKIKRLQVKIQESESAYRSFIQESLSNILVIKSFENEENSSKQLSKLQDNRFYWIYRRSKLSMISSTTLGLSFNIGYIAAFAFGALQLSRQAITYGTMSVFLTLVNRIQAPIMELGQNIPKIANVMASVGRVMELQDIPVEDKSEVTLENENVGMAMSHVTFGYTDETVLEDVTMDIQPGEFVALVGESGIGKTTLIRLIMSFMKNQSGNIFFENEKGQRELADAGIRGLISYVPQGNTLFSGTIRANIQMGRLDATEEEMEEALKIASGYEFVMQLPEGMDTVIGERGHGLSEGQAQRIAIARALVRKAPFLILDEATSSLDEKTELKVLEGIRKIAPKPTCLLITHRRSVLKYCDREVKIVNKRIYESMVG